ncbi:MAG: hypothetical protein H6834_11400 [Planctomycetes bacterium]|nr:hypothetical protein [Planctomycetota bacterium]
MTTDWIPKGLAFVAAAMMGSCATTVRPGADAGLAARLMAAPDHSPRAAKPAPELSFRASADTLAGPQDPEPPKVDLQDVLRRLDEQDAVIRELKQRDEERTQQMQKLEEEMPDPPKFEVLYKKGFILRSTKDAETPFELKIGGRMQLRYVGFAARNRLFRNLETDASGNPIRPNDVNLFEIERARLTFGGMWLDPKMHFYINMDADTDDNHQVAFQDFWVNYDFDDAFQLYVGKAFMPGSRAWLDGATSTHMADRSMATSFFRPDRSVGVWAMGEPVEDFHYRVMLGNGLSTADLAPADVNDQFAYAASVWVEPLGDFGEGLADLECHEDPVARFGSSFMYGAQAGMTSSGATLSESRFVRLSDGSRLTGLGVSHYDEYMLAVDGAVKWQGFSMNAEGYLRWLRDIRPLAAPPAGFPDNDQDDAGFYVDAGFFVIPKTLEPVVRYSAVYGRQKQSSEYGLGLNWYVDDTGHNNKLTLDATWLNGSPISNSGANYRVGDNGFRLMIQWQIAF